MFLKNSSLDIAVSEIYTFSQFDHLTEDCRRDLTKTNQLTFLKKLKDSLGLEPKTKLLLT